MTVPIRVLFVCLGNICRSPMAQGILDNMIQNRGLKGRIQVESAGTGNYHMGERPDKRATAMCREQGMDISGQRARQLSRDDMETFDYILAMDRQNLKDIHAKFGISWENTHVELLMSYHPDGKLADVPDPYYGGEDGFVEVFSLIQAACSAFLDSLEKEHGGT